MLKKLLIVALVIAVILVVGYPLLKKGYIWYGHHQQKKYYQTHQAQFSEGGTTTVTGAPAATNTPTTIKSSATTTVYHNVSYGTDPLNIFDVYAPKGVTNAPIIFMVHGGAWQIGDKTSTKVVDNKVKYWLPKGYIFISVDYPMLPNTKPDGQAAAVANALTYVEQHAADWGGNASKIISMGHSAGGHLVALVSTTQDQYPNLKPWSGTVLLDSAGLNVVYRMQVDPTNIFTNAFGTDQAYWTAMSPTLQMTKAHEPVFVVCSSKRQPKTDCDPAQAFVDKLTGLGGSASLYKVALVHEEINANLGLPSAYTSAVDAFMTQALNR